MAADVDPRSTGGDVGATPTAAPGASLLPATAAQWLVLALGLAVLAGVAGSWLASRRASGPAASSVDVGFLQDMASHHEQAIELSNVALTSDVGPDVGIFAREILYFQGYEMGLMDRQLQQWGFRREQRPELAMEWMGMPTPVTAMAGMATDDQVALLRQLTGPEAAALFVELMQAHHRGGVAMATYAAEHASEPFVRDLAGRMARNQAIEIQELEAAAERADLPAPPRTASGGAAEHGSHD